MLSDLIGALLWKLDHIFDLVAAERSPATLEVEHTLVAFCNDVLSQVSHGLEILTVHLVPLSRRDVDNVLLLELEQRSLVVDLFRLSVVYALDHSEVLRMLAVGLLEHLELSFVLCDLLVAKPVMVSSCSQVSAIKGLLFAEKLKLLFDLRQLVDCTLLLCN